MYMEIVHSNNVGIHQSTSLMAYEYVAYVHPEYKKNIIHTYVNTKKIKTNGLAKYNFVLIVVYCEQKKKYNYQTCSL